MSMKMRSASGVSLFSAAIVAATLLGGCRGVDPAVKRSQQAVDLLVDTRQSLVVGEQTTVESQTALRTLRQSKSDLRPAFDVFGVELDAVRKQADRVKRESERVRAQAAVYCSARQNDIHTISNDDMRQAAEARTARMREQCDKINEMYGQTNAAFDNYIRNLSDLQTYLANELNYGALESGQRWVDQALTSGEMLRGHIRGLALQLDLISNVLSPVPIATAQWTTPLPPTDAMAERR